MISYSQKEKRIIIMNNYLKSENKVDTITLPLVYNGNSTSCIDHVTIGIYIKADQIIKLQFKGEGCAICLASTNLMLNLIKFKTLNEVQEIIDNYQKMLNQEKYDEDLLKELNVFQNVANHLNRVRCAKVVIMALNEFLEDWNKKINNQ